MKKISIVVEDTKKGKVVIPMIKKDFNSMFDYIFMAEDNDGFVRTLKLNHDYESFIKLHNISAKVLDALYEGKCYQVKTNSKKRIVSEHKFWMSGKPVKWIKE